jgi:hypothetical protein
MPKDTGGASEVGAQVPGTAKQTIEACLALVCVSDDSSSWQVIKQRYATRAFTPEEKARDALRRTGWANLLIARGAMYKWDRR